MTNWKGIHPDFTEELQRKWEERGFNYKTCKSWIDFGCQLCEVDLADYLYECQKNKLDKDIKEDIEKARIEYAEWKSFSLDLENIMPWKKHDFIPEQFEKWIEVGLGFNDYDFVAYLTKQGCQPQDKLNYEELKEEYYNKSGQSQEWLDKNYPEKNRSRVQEIYLNEPSLEGELDLGDFVYYSWNGGVKVYFSSQVDETKLIFKNLPKVAEIVPLDAQKWLDKNYPENGTCVRKDNYGRNHFDFAKQRKEITKLDINYEILEKELDLSGFVNLKELNCSLNRLTSLDLSNCPELEEINCPVNQLTNLDVSSCSRLTGLYCWDNKLTNLILPANLTNLKYLDLNNNNFPPQDLSFLTSYINLETLRLRNNKFTGSLDYLSEMENLKELNIINTDINEVNIDKLPRSLEYIGYFTDKRLNCKLTQIIPQLELFRWGQQGFNYEQARELISIGFEPNEYSNAKEWKNKNFTAEQVKELISIGFRPSESNQAKNWKDRNFNIQQIEEWLNAGLKPNDYENVSGWKNKNFTPQQTKEWISAGAKSEDYEFVVWFRDTKNLGPKWITDYKEDYQTLSEKFKKYGSCLECKQLNTGEQWCQPCNVPRLQQDFSSWTSGNSKIDQFIQKYQLEATDEDKFIEWIPFERLETEKDKEGKEKVLGEGGFGKVYKVKWTRGNVHYWWRKKWYKEKTPRIVVLKSLNNTKDITNEFLQEVANHKIIDDWFDSIVPCYGISQDPKTKNYLMVMKYVEGGDLRKHLQKNYRNLSFENKLLRLINIAQGLKDIHQKNLIHRDFHSGNILSNEERCFITDLGLSKLSSEASDGKVFGVLPYVAPEVLTKKTYSKASDIYSFGIIAWEILSGNPPYREYAHDEFLAVEMCQGLRPNLNEIIAPQLLKDLINKCWDAEPNNRPTASELTKTSRGWQDEIKNKKAGKFYQQYVETEKLNHVKGEKRTCELLSELYKRYKGETIEIKLGEIQKTKDELYSEFCQRHRYEKNSKEAREKFEQLFSKVDNLNYKFHSSAIYTSRLLDFKSLPEPQNSKEINEKFYKTLELSENLTKVDELLQEPNNSKKTLELINYFLGKSRELTKELEKIMVDNPSMSEEGKKALKGLKDKLRAKDNAYQELKEQSKQEQNEEREQEIKLLEAQIRELTTVVEKQKEKIMQAYLYFAPEKELLQDLIKVQLELTSFEKQEFNSPNYGIKSWELEKKYGEIKGKLYSKLTKREEINEMQQVVVDCKQLVDWELELENKLKDKFLLLENQGQIFQITDEPITQNNPVKQINFPQDKNKELQEISSINYLQGKISKIEEFIGDLQIQSNGWTTLHPSFSSQLVNQWANQGFSPSQTHDWLSIGLQPSDHHFAAFLRDQKHLSPEEVLNHGNLEQLNQEFSTWQAQQFRTQQEQPPK